VSQSGEFVVLAVLLGLFGAMGAGLWYATKVRRTALVRLREAAAISAESVSNSRILIVLLAGIVVAVGSAPLLMWAFPKTPMMFLVSVVLAFAAVFAPLTFARGLTVDTWLALEPGLLRLERRSARPMVVDLRRPFSLETTGSTTKYWSSRSKTLHAFSSPTGRGRRSLPSPCQDCRKVGSARASDSRSSARRPR